MSNYTVDELIARWKKEDMTADQMIGQLLLLLKDVDRRLKELRREQGDAGATPQSQLRH